MYQPILVQKVHSTAQLDEKVEGFVFTQRFLLPNEVK